MHSSSQLRPMLSLLWDLQQECQVGRQVRQRLMISLPIRGHPYLFESTIQSWMRVSQLLLEDLTYTSQASLASDGKSNVLI